MGTWSIGGNALGNASQGVLGTTDGNALVLETAGLERMRIDPSGNIDIGTANPAIGVNVYVQDFSVESSEIWLGLGLSGGGKLRIANNTNDNRIYLEAYSSDASTSATEMLLTGFAGTPIPQITLVANTTVLTGDLAVVGPISSPTIAALEGRIVLSEQRLLSMQDELASLHTALAEARAHS
jgi:hypothetical protein